MADANNLDALRVHMGMMSVLCGATKERPNAFYIYWERWLQTSLDAPVESGRSLLVSGIGKLTLYMNPLVLGLIAGAFTTFASLPQIIYVLRTRSMKDISLITLSMFACGVSLWLCYGIVIHATPVIVWNLLSLSLYLTQIALKITLSGAGLSQFWRRSSPSGIAATRIA